MAVVPGLAFFPQPAQTLPSRQQLKGGDPVSHCSQSAPVAAAWISVAVEKAA